MDGQTDGSCFIGCCLTDVECPITMMKTQIKKTLPEDTETMLI